MIEFHLNTINNFLKEGENFINSDALIIYCEPSSKLLHNSGKIKKFLKIIRFPVMREMLEKLKKKIIFKL